MNLIVSLCGEDDIKFFIGFATGKNCIFNGAGILENVSDEFATFHNVASVSGYEGYIEPILVVIIIDNNVRIGQAGVDERIGQFDNVSHGIYHPFKIFESTILYYKFRVIAMHLKKKQGEQHCCPLVLRRLLITDLISYTIEVTDEVHALKRVCRTLPSGCAGELFEEKVLDGVTYYEVGVMKHPAFEHLA